LSRDSHSGRAPKKRLQNSRVPRSGRIYSPTRVSTKESVPCPSNVTKSVGTRRHELSVAMPRHAGCRSRLPRLVLARRVETEGFSLPALTTFAAQKSFDRPLPLNKGKHLWHVYANAHRDQPVPTKLTAWLKSRCSASPPFAAPLLRGDLGLLSSAATRSKPCGIPCFRRKETRKTDENADAAVGTVRRSGGAPRRRLPTPRSTR